MSNFTPNCLPLLIGSLPVDSHRYAAELIFDHTPNIPIWPQLPAFKMEGMVLQFLPGMPGVREMDGKTFIDTESAAFEGEFLSFYEEYLMVTEGAAELDGSRFALTTDVAKGFFEFLEIAEERKSGLTLLKGQITGPITFCTGVVDQSGRAIFYNEQLRDAAIKLLALKAQWQARKMTGICGQSVIFFDEPALAGFGSSAFITITPDDIKACFAEVFAAVKAENGLTGVHVCANTEWSVIFDTGVDVLSYDAYSYFDKLILYPEHLRNFFDRGGILATGIIPTSAEFIEDATVDSLVAKWFEQTMQLEALGMAKTTVYAQSLITPSCGTGTVTPAQALKVMELTRDVSAQIQEKISSQS